MTSDDRRTTEHRTAAAFLEEDPWASNGDRATANGSDGADPSAVTTKERPRVKRVRPHPPRMPQWPLPPRATRGAPPSAPEAPPARRTEKRSTELVHVGRSYATNWRQRRPWLIVAGLVVLGLVIRLVLMRSIWVDEAISIHQAHMSLPGMLDNLRETDRHPPLHYLILWLTVRLFGDGEAAVRLPSIIASAALIPTLFVLGRDLFDRRTGLVAAAFATVAPLVVWYGQEARMYSLFMLLAALALLAQVKVLRDGRTRWWVLYAALTIALLYTHYFAVIPIAIQQVVFAIAAWKRARAGHPVRSLLIGNSLTWIALLAAAAPLAPFALDQYSQSQTSGMGFGGAPSAAAPLSIPGSSASLYAILSNFVWAIWGYHANSTILRIAALWPLLMLLSLALMGQRRSDATRVVLALGLGPILILLFIGLVKRDLFEVRYFVAAVPMMLLLLARAVAGGPRRRLPALVGTTLLTLTLVVGLADQQLNPNNPREFDFRGALEQIQDEAKPGDTIVYAPEYLRDVVGYYTPGIRSEPLSAAQKRGMPTSGRVFLLASFLEDGGTSAAVGSARYTLDQRPHKLLDTITRKRIHIWVYS